MENDFNDDSINDPILYILNNELKVLYGKLMYDKNFLRVLDLLADMEEGNIIISHDQFTIVGVKRSIRILYGWDLFKYIQLYYQVDKGYIVKEVHVYLSFDENLSSYVTKLVKNDKELYIHYLGEIPKEVYRSIYI